MARPYLPNTPVDVALNGISDKADAALIDTLLADDFDRGKTGFTLTGQPWNELAGDLGVSAGELTASVTSQIVADSGATDGSIRVKFRHLGGSTSIVFRSSNDLNDRLMLSFDASNSDARFQKVVATVSTPLKSSKPITYKTDGSTVYRGSVTFIDSELRGYLNGRLVVTHLLSDADRDYFSGFTRVGLRSSGAGMRVTSFIDQEAYAGEDNTLVRQISGNYTLTASDIGKTIEQISNAGGTLTIPAGIGAQGDGVYLLNCGTGVWTVAAPAGTTLNNPGVVGSQWAGKALYWRGSTETVLLS